MKNLFTFLIAILLVGGVYAQSWVEMAKTLPTPNETVINNNLGQAVDIDGDIAVVGNAGINNSSGIVYILEYYDGEWDNVAILKPSYRSSGLYFGYSVSISGNTIVVGTGANKAYVFEKSGADWTDMTETAVLLPSNAPNSYFGYSVDISGDNIIVGADFGGSSGEAYIFTKPGVNWTDMTETAKLTATNISSSARFGGAVSIDGDIVVVGANRDTPSGSRSGSAFIFEKSGSAWTDMTETAKLTVSNGAAYRELGCSVDVSSDNVVVGEKRGEIAYVYTKPVSGWANTTETAQLTSSDGAAYDGFAKAVRIDGDNILVGADFTDGSVSSSGSAYIYTKPMSGWVNATETAKFTASDEATNDLFGGSVAISNDKLIIGASEDDENENGSGSVYLFSEPTSGGWVNSTEFWKYSNGWAPQTTIGYNYGGNVAVDGDYAVVGAEGYNNSKSCVFVLYNNAGTWETVAALTASDGLVNEHFGISVSIDGDNIVVGASQAGAKGAAYVFTKPSSGWADATETAKLMSSDIALYDNYGVSVSISGDNIVVGSKNDDDGASNSGSVYVFTKPSSGWVDATETAKLVASDPASNDYFGKKVRIYGDNIVVGVPDKGNSEGAVYVYTKSGSTWVNATEIAILTPSDLSNGYLFGTSIDIFSDNIVVGSKYSDGVNATQSGAVYLFSKPNSGWATTNNEGAKFSASDGQSYDFFGTSVSISPNYIVIGAEGDNTNYRGFAYVFEKPAPGWTSTTETIKLTPSDGNENDYYAKSVAISADKIIIGSAFHEGNADNSGAAYIYTQMQEQIISFDAIPEKTYGDASFTISATGGASGNPVVFTSSDNNIVTCTGTNGETITIINAGTCIISANQAGNATYSAAQEVQQTLIVNKKTILAELEPMLYKIYGDSDPALNYTYNPALVGSDTFTGALTREAGEDVGYHNVLQGTLALSSNYNLYFLSSDNLEIYPKNITVTADAGQSKVYGDSEPTFTYSNTALAFSDVFTGSLSRDAGENVGNYPITQGTLALSSNYNLNFVSSDFEITPMDITVTADAGLTKVYGDSDPSFTYTATSLLNGDSYSGMLSRITGEDVGTYAITQGNLTAGANYILTFNSSSFDITPMAITVTADAGFSKVYGEVDPTFTYTATSLINGDSYSGSLSRDAGENVGTYAISQGSLTANSNYSLTFIANNFDITAMDITVTVDAGQTKVYGEVDPTFTYSATSLVNGDSYSGMLSRDAGENVGTYAIAQGSLMANSNYNLTFIANNFDITAMDITVTVDAGQTKVYGELDPTFTYTATSLVNGDSYSGMLSRDAGEDAGTYAINQGSLIANSNYNLNFVANNFEITKANPVISWATPEDIEEGTALSTTELNATADIAGAFNYTPAEGTVLALGDNQELTVEFTPTDVTNYNVANSSVYINVVTNVKVSEISDNSISIYPNPTNGLVKLDLADYVVKEIIISDLKGSVILRKQNLSRIENLDLSDAIRGVYVVSLVTEQNEIIIRRLIKE